MTVSVALPNRPARLPAFQNYCAFNALNLEAAWAAAPDRSQALWRGIAAQGDNTWAQRFAPLIDRLMSAPAPAIGAGRSPRL